MKKVSVVILAAGKGTRMNSDMPKVLHLLKEKPLVQYVIDAVAGSQIEEKPICVVGYKAQEVQHALGGQVVYVEQKEQKGTGHSVQVAKDHIADSDYTLVLYGDMPRVSSETINALIAEHEKHAHPMTMATTTVEDFDDWRKGFYSFGRVIRDEQGAITRLVEKKDASPEELLIREVNPAQFIFTTKWLLENIDKLSSDNAQSEYYLTDMVAMAFDQTGGIGSISIDPQEALGVNTAEQLELIESLLDV
jgi:bifunctional UDP-N-acetylglucosamine pyrophosphorylase/glucosamine-1-phosphate N-acetyltransferase